MLNLLYALRLRTPPQKEEIPTPRYRPLILDIADKLEQREPFSIVHILVDQGDVNYVHGLVGGKLTGLKGICVIVPIGRECEVHEALDKLTEAQFASRVRVGSAATYANRDGITAGKLLVEAQNNYKAVMYVGKKPVTQRSMASPVSVSA